MWASAGRQGGRGHGRQGSVGFKGVSDAVCVSQQTGGQTLEGHSQWHTHTKREREGSEEEVETVRECKRESNREILLHRPNDIIKPAFLCMPE